MTEISDINSSLSWLAVSTANRTTESRTLNGLKDPSDALRTAAFQTQTLPADNDVPAFTIFVDENERTSGRLERDINSKLNSIFELFYRGDFNASSNAATAGTEAFGGLIKTALQDEDVDSIQIRMGTLTTNFGQGTQGITGFTGLIVQGNVVRDGEVTTKETLFIDLEGKQVNLPEADVFNGFPTGVYEKTVENKTPSLEEQRSILEVIQNNFYSIRSAISGLNEFNGGDAAPITDALNQIAGKTLFTVSS